MTDLSEVDEFESNDKELGTFVANRTYSPSRQQIKDNIIELEIMSQEENDLELISKNFHHPGLLNDDKENFNEKKKMLINLNLVKCKPKVEMESTQIASNYVEEFSLDPTHDYSKYSASSRYELNKNFNKINQ